MWSSGMLCTVALEVTNILEKMQAIFRVLKIIAVNFTVETSDLI